MADIRQEGVLPILLWLTFAKKESLLSRQLWLTFAKKESIPTYSKFSNILPLRPLDTTTVADHRQEGNCIS